MADIIQLRRDTEENWLKYNPILLEGEVGVIKGTIHYKIGDGIHNWSELPLGGVKSGEDIIIQPDGTMQIVDDSHNHSIANVTGLQEKLDEKRNGLVKSLIHDDNQTFDWNDVTIPGSYTINQTGDSRAANAPSTGPYGTLVVEKSGGRVLQMYYPDYPTGYNYLCVRVKVGTAWRDWQYYTTLNHIDETYATKTENNEKVDKVSGMGLSHNDYTDDDKDKLDGIASGAEVNTIVAVQRNGTAITPNDRIVNILVPVKTSELTNDSAFQTEADIAETIIGVDLNIASGIITLTRKNGTTFTIDLPTEKIIKSGYYDSVSEEIVLVLADESEIRFNASQLIDEYYADNVTLEQYTDTVDGNKKKFRIKTAYKNKIDGSEQTTNKTASVSSSSTETQYPTAKAVYNAVKDLATKVQTFTQASTRANIESGETISTIFGKIRKWLADLKAVAFSGSYDDLTDKPTIGNGKVTIKQKGVEKGSFTMNQSGDATVELTDENTTYGIATSATLGLVKSGEDIIIQPDGTMQVNDDSHNHVINNVTGLQKELNTKVAKILLPVVGNSSEVYVKIATVNLTSTQSNTAQALISGTGDFGGIEKDVAIVSICGRTTNGTQHIRLLKLDKASYNWSIGCGYVKGSNSIDFYLQLNKFNGSSSLIPISEYGATFNTDLTVITTKPSGWVDGSVGNVYSDFNKPDFDITSEGTEAVTDNTLLLTSNAAGIAASKTIFRRPVTLIWNYIKSKISSELGLSTSYSGVAKYSNDLRGNIRSRNNNSRYIEIGRISVPTSAYTDNSLSIYVKGAHNSNFGDSYIFNVTLGTNDKAVPYASLHCVMASRTNYNEVLVGELTSTHLILYLDCILQNYCSWSYSKLSDVYNALQYTSGNVYVASIPANGGTKVSQSNKMLAIIDGDGNNIASTYRKLSGILEITDSNLATYFNSSTGALTIPNGVTTILFNTGSTKKVFNIVGGCAVNGYRLTIAGQWLPVQKTSSSTTGCFSSFIYGYRAGASGTSFDGATNRLTEAFEDFIYFNGVWYSKAY